MRLATMIVETNKEVYFLIRGVRSSSATATIDSDDTTTTISPVFRLFGLPKSSIPSLRCRTFHAIHMIRSDDCIIPATRNVIQLVQFVPGLVYGQSKKSGQPHAKEWKLIISPERDAENHEYRAGRLDTHHGDT